MESASCSGVVGSRGNLEDLEDFEASEDYADEVLS